MDIADFLLARIAEDEAVARSGAHPNAQGLRWEVEDETWYLEGVEHDVVGPGEVAFTHPGTVDHIARHDPARVLAECQAKRAIVEVHRSEVRFAVVYRESDRLLAEALDEGNVPVLASAAIIPTCLRYLAAVYADHPDYRSEWKP